MINILIYMDIADWISGKIPDGFLKMVSRYIYKHYKIKLSKDQLRKLLKMIHTVNTEMDQIKIVDNGEDLKIKDAVHDSDGNHAGRNSTFGVRTGILKNISGNISNQRNDLVQMAEGIASVREKLGFHYAGLIGAMIVQEQQIHKYGEYLEQLGKSLLEISDKYETAEKKICQNP